MGRMSKKQWYVCIGILVVCIVLLVWVYNDRSQYDARCNAAQGFVMRIHSGTVCIDRDVLIELP